MRAASSATRWAGPTTASTGERRVIRFLAFSIKRAWEGLWRNIVMSLAATATMVLMLLLLAGLLIVVTGLNAALDYFESKVEVTAFVRDGTPQPRIDEVMGIVRGMPEVA